MSCFADNCSCFADNRCARVPRVRGTTVTDGIYLFFMCRSVELDFISTEAIEAGAAVAGRVARMTDRDDQAAALCNADALLRAEIAHRWQSRMRRVGPRCGSFDDPTTWFASA